MATAFMFVELTGIPRVESNINSARSSISRNRKEKKDDYYRDSYDDDYKENTFEHAEFVESIDTKSQAQ